MRKAAIIRFPGSNCDSDCFHAVRAAGFEVEYLWHKDSPSLSALSLVVLPGGFSYGDYLRCGAMAACSPVMESVKAFAEGGGLVIGICNGFQILCEAKLLPGALIGNASGKFICRDVTVNVAATDNPWLKGFQQGEQLNLPIAHGDGCYWIEEHELDPLFQRGQVLLTYANNPNGSVRDIAGISNEKKNVFGLMPHPDRATYLRSRSGMKMWQSVLSHLGDAGGRE